MPTVNDEAVQRPKGRDIIPPAVAVAISRQVPAQNAGHVLKEGILDITAVT